jgi:hypothetical protein
VELAVVTKAVCRQPGERHACGHGQQTGTAQPGPSRTHASTDDRQMHPKPLCSTPHAGGCHRRLRFRFVRWADIRIGEITGSFIRKADDHDGALRGGPDCCWPRGQSTSRRSSIASPSSGRPRSSRSRMAGSSSSSRRAASSSGTSMRSTRCFSSSPGRSPFSYEVPTTSPLVPASSSWSRDGPSIARMRPRDVS